MTARRPLLLMAACAAAGAAAALPPCPARAQSAPSVSLTTPRPYLLLGSDAAVELTVEVTGPGAESFTPARTFATVGTLDAPQPAGAPGRFTARYLPPGDRFPQVALLAVELAHGAQRLRGVARLPLYGATELPLRTNAGAQVTMRIGERSFGPVPADRQGFVKIPIEVPPGVRSGLARAVDRGGAVRETEVDLQPAPFRRVLIVAPEALEVASFAEVAVLAVDPAGEPVPSGRLSLRASEGLVHPLGGGATTPGEARFLVEAPRRLGGGALALTAVAAGTPLGRADLAVPLLAGPPKAVSLALSTRRLVVGGGAPLRVTVSAQDQFGNPTSAQGAVALWDHQPAAIETTAGGHGLLEIAAPVRWPGRDRATLEVALGAARASEEIRLTGGTPAGLTLQVAEARLVADGRRATELRVRAVDKNGTPTMVPGLSWETPGGHIRRVRMPREGEYVADFVPYRAQHHHQETVAVMASQSLRAAATLEVAPPPERLLAAARVGLFTNLGHAAGPAAFLEALTPVRLGRTRFAAGVQVGYLHDDISIAGASSPAAAPAPVQAQLMIDQMPLLAVARYRLPWPLRPELSVDGGVGLSLARTRIVAAAGPVEGVRASARGPAAQAGAEAAFPLRPGRLFVGVRYLWVALGQTSHGDDLRGNSAGLLGDLGYRISW